MSNKVDMIKALTELMHIIKRDEINILEINVTNGEYVEHGIDFSGCPHSLREGEIRIRFVGNKEKYSQSDIYKYLYDKEYGYLMSHKIPEDEFEEYEEWCRRKATQEAVKNTVKEWRKQYDA